MYARSKEYMRDSYPWSESVQVFPHALTPRMKPHKPRVKPGVSPLKEWPYLDVIQRDLKKFYLEKLAHKVTSVPEDVRQGT